MAEKQVQGNSQPGISSGALIGLLLTTPLIAIAYLAWESVRLPFPPYIVFDQITRLLPGWLITTGIDQMVKVIRGFNIPETAEVAKEAEQSMAILGFLIGGAVLTALYFFVMRFIKPNYYLISGIALGVLIGAGIFTITQSLTQSYAFSPLVIGVWIMSIFLIWGIAEGLIYKRMTTSSVVADLQQKEKREERFSVEKVDRRRFMVKLGSVAAFITVTGAIVGEIVGSRSKSKAETSEGLWSSSNPLPNEDAAVEPAPGTRPEYTPLSEHYRIDINTIVPMIDEESWRLRVDGLVEKPFELTLDEIKGYEPLNQFVTLSCISNPVGGDLIGTLRWTGVSLQKLLSEFSILPNASHLKIRSADGFYESVSIDDIRADERIMLAYAWDGVPLLPKHGFPLRIYIPNVYGMKQPKWIESIEVMDHWEEGYWVTRGWDKQAIMKATSVIDTIAMGKMIRNEDGKPLVPIGGIAHAGARGISKVEVQVDEGPWEEAKIRQPLSEKTWVIWRYDWPLKKGKHSFTVRCFDGNGNQQIVEESSPHPSGATGLYSKKVRL